MNRTGYKKRLPLPRKSLVDKNSCLLIPNVPPVCCSCLQIRRCLYMYHISDTPSLNETSVHPILRCFETCSCIKFQAWTYERTDEVCADVVDDNQRARQ